MNTIIILLALFGIKHFIADFVLQSDTMLKDKGTYGAPGGREHAAWHGILTFFVLVWFVNPYTAMLLALVDAFIHYHIDWAKTNLSRGLTPSDRKFWIYLGADQGLHYLTYIGIIGVLVL
jgi:hypothetical protein